MDYTTFSLIHGGLGFVQSILMSAVVWVLFWRTRHGAEWFLFALLPVCGLIILPFWIMMGFALISHIQIDHDIGTQLVTMSGTFLVFLFNLIPLAVLAWRLSFVEIGRDV